jgi:hypothetical protein
MSHNVDHEINRFIEGMVGSIGRPLTLAGTETFEKFITKRPSLKVDIKSPIAGVNDDVQRVQDLRSIGLTDAEIKMHILDSAACNRSHDPEKYANTVFKRATVLTKQHEKEHGKEISKSMTKIKEQQITL